jgi:hypothetical protein
VRKINPWFEITGVVLVALLGVFLGRVFSGFRKPYWLLGHFLGFVLIVILALARYYNALYFIRPFSWVTTGRVQFVILSLAVTMGLTTPLSRLSHRYEKLLVCVLMAVVVTWFCVLPFLNGICLQTTSYTCGPAAAVTALGKLGLSADEGEMAVLSYTSPFAGTILSCLSSAVQNRYGADGLRCQYRHFDSIEQLKDAGITLAVVRNAFLLDHCLTVLEVSDHTITVADPVIGRKVMPYKQFEKIWRFSGIVFKRDSTKT